MKTLSSPIADGHALAAGSLHQIFERQANRAPRAVALSFDDQQLTYAELNQRANQLAHYLKKLGVTRETPVALCLERSLNMVVAILGVLKAGGAYVPIDLAYPPERLAFMLEDTQAPVLLTQEALLGLLPASKAEVLCLDREAAAIAEESVENLVRDTSDDSLAYIIFTSGSTGKPKGVLVTHQNVVRLFTQTERWFGFTDQDVWTLFHSYAFDFSVWEIWGALLYGGRLVVPPYLVSRSPAAFYELLGREGVTVLNQTPSAFRQLIWAEANAAEKQPIQLRYVIFGGEALQLAALEPWFALHSDSQPLLINMYGITETTVHVTYRPIRRADVERGLGSVIGAPIPDLELHLLDENLQPVARGCPGEICVGGAGVARGYLNRPELTAEKFIKHPLAGDGGRLYRSGDLARFLPDGELEYLGRRDHQVKIRGFRIELGEIESLLQQQPGVRECAVVARLQGDQQRLIAYVAGEGSVTELRQALGRKLPDYMIPAVFVFVAALPITVNGKVDLKALPEPESVRPDLNQKYVAAATAAELVLSEIWREALELDRVGVNDNFFELGGDSIRSIRVLARAQERGLPLSLEQLFGQPTIYQLARLDHGPVEDVGASPQPFSLLSAQDHARLPLDLEDAYPMAKLQLGMVFHSDYDLASAIFHDVFSFRIKMAYDHALFREAAQRLAQRHPIFRTSFDLGGYSEPLQLVHNRVEVPLTLEDLRRATNESRRTALEDWVEAEKRRRFVWSEAPLLRLHVQQYEDETFQCVVSFHHIIMDGWSLAAMLTELLRDYAALLQGRAKEIPPPRIAYRDFVALERDAVSSETVRDFWRKKLAGVTLQPLPRWPKAMRRGGREQMRGPEIIFPETVLTGLQALAHDLRVPFRTVLLAAHCRVMSYLTGQTDITTGLVTNGRPQTADGEKVIGLFLNTLPLRAQTGGGSWRELVKHIFAAEKEIIPNRRAPLSEVQQLAGGQPLFETAFDFVQFHVYRDIPGYGEHTFLEDYYFEANNFNFYATFMLNAEASELQMHFDYNPNEFCDAQIRLICGYYVQALEVMAANPDGRYETAALLSPDEKEKLLVTWNATAQDFPQLCVHRIFEREAEKTPDSPAVTFAAQTLSYRELNDRANHWAARLRADGVGAGALVGIHCERSLEMLISVLAVMKTGAAYVPLDPRYPSERLDFMMSDAGLKLILTQEKFRGALSNDSRIVVAVDSIAGELCDSPNAVVGEATLDDVAYTIYTSGSTGQPKGVQIQHRALINFLASMKAKPGLSREDTLLAVTTLSFDISGLELLLPLTVGAHLIIADGETALDFPALARLLETSGATCLQATPTTWRGLLECEWPGNKRLKALCGGEALPRDLADRLLDHCGELWNMYGPTETTIWSTLREVTKEAGPVPIGRPIANTQVYLLDSNLIPVPTGSEGEIYLGGEGLALGYFKRPALTAEKFIANPFGSTTGARLYRTGDIGRYLPDGTLICEGRVDQQVKLRGFRIELGEIETVLGSHPAVAAAVVAIKGQGSDERRLVAYWVGRNDQSPAPGELRGHLAQRLPAQMLPSHFVRLEKLPLTPNGKIDRKKLPEPECSRPDLEKIFIAPRTPIETLLAETWSDVLKIERVGINDNFFELGGHSLSAMQVIARLRCNFDASITVASFFEHPTIEEFAFEMMVQLAGAETVLPEEIGLLQTNPQIEIRKI